MFAHDTIATVREKLMKREVRAQVLVEEYQNRIDSHNDTLHAYLEIFDDAIKDAKAFDQGERDVELPLAGIPIAIKDNILIKGKNVTAASKILENYTATYTATAIRKLQNAGAIILGRTNNDEFAMGGSTENSAFGSTKNPWDITRVPGGSSGGSAAAVAGDLCVAAIGSDTGGSIRQPASFCGIVGYKPTYGTISRNGLIALASSLDQIGPLTKTVDDAVLLADVMSGVDAFDSTTSEKQPSSLSEEYASFDIKGKKIGLPKEYFSEKLDPRISTIIKNEVAKLENVGATVSEVSLPLTKYSLPVYYIIMPAEASSNLARFDGIRYGLTDRSGGSLESVYINTRTKGFGDEVRRRLMIGTYVLSSGYYDAYYGRAQKVRQMIKNEFEKVFHEVDLLVTPTAPTTAFVLGAKTDPVEMYLQDIFTVSANIAGIPGVSIPAGKVDDLPVGMQVLGPQFADGAVLGLAGTLEQHIGFKRLQLK